MNKKRYFFIFFIALILSVPHKAHAQTDSDWQPIYLLVTGDNTMDGVEASFKVNTCNGKDIIHIKFINHNEYSVKLEWFDAVFTQELKWINKDQAIDKKSLLLSANKEISGSCSNNIHPELIVKVDGFVAKKKDFKRYSASQLTITAVR